MKIMKCQIIAEIGWNHMGDRILAESMVAACAAAGADFAKFQTWSVENLKPGEWDFDGRREIYEKANLVLGDYEYLYDCANANGIKFMTSIFSTKDLDKIPLKYTNYIKIPSPEITNIDLITECSKRFDHLIISTGASTMQEVDNAHRLCVGRCTLMHCVSVYPCPLDAANLGRIRFLKGICPSVGYSDHTQGVTAPAYAMSNECTFVEKHFTTDNDLPGRDNKFAANPECLKEICRIRDEIEQMLHQPKSGVDFQESEISIRESYRGRWG